MFVVSSLSECFYSKTCPVEAARSLFEVGPLCFAASLYLCCFFSEFLLSSFYNVSWSVYRFDSGKPELGTLWSFNLK